MFVNHVSSQNELKTIRIIVNIVKSYYLSLIQINTKFEIIIKRLFLFFFFFFLSIFSCKGKRGTMVGRRGIAMVFEKQMGSDSMVNKNFCNGNSYTYKQLFFLAKCIPISNWNMNCTLVLGNIGLLRWNLYSQGNMSTQ